MSFSELDHLYGDCAQMLPPRITNLQFYGSVSWDSLFVMARASTLLIATRTVGAFRDESSPLPILYTPTEFQLRMSQSLRILARMTF